MPAAPAASSLAAPPGVTIVPPSTPPRPPPAPTREIHVGTASASIPSTVVPATDAGPGHSPPKPGSARERLSQAMRKKAGIAEPEPEPQVDQAVADGAKPAGDTEDSTPGADEQTPETPATPPKAATPVGQKPKVNPWKLVDQWKAKTAELEKKVAEASSLPEQAKKQYLTQIEQLQKRNETLENEMRFVNYAESEEFKSKYDAPYKKAWEAALSEMAELTVTDPQTQAVRQVTAQDLMDLCNLPLVKAREYANELYGDFADDMMAHRKETRSLFQTREQALKEAKEQGAERDKQRREMFQKQSQELSDFIKTTWEKANAEMIGHEKYGKFFSPIEGDQDGNQRLAKGFELVDRAYSENSNNPNLTPEQRKSIVERHAAVRNRAAAFGRLVAMNDAKEAKIAELTKELEQFKGSTPPSGGSAPPSGQPTTPGNPMDRVFDALRKRAK